MKTRQTSFILGIFTFIVVAFLIWLSSVSSGIEGGMDSYNHYLIAKHSWQNPHLFLNYWGKPVYNVIASPFAQFGLNGMIFLNLLSLVFSAWLMYKVAIKLGWKKYAFLAYVLTLLSPIFLDNTISSLTEPLCALLVSLTIYFIADQKINAAALMAGLLPHVRSEGFIILFAVFVYMIFSKQKLKSFLYLGIGSLIFNTLGWIITKEPLWIITQNPYINFEMSGNNICGSGGLFHYVWTAHYTFGIIVSALLALGTILYLRNLIKHRGKKDLIVGLVIACFALYFASHSFIWYKGMMGSCGYIRVMAVIAPLGSLIAVYFLHNFFNYLKDRHGKIGKYLSVGIVVLVIAHVIYVPFRYYSYKYPLTITAEQEQFEILNDWYQKQGFEDRTKLYLYPYFSIIADIDPYNQDEHLELWKSSLQWSKKGDILIWDGHFGPNESGLPLDTLKQNPDWTQIHSVVPQTPFKTLNNHDFEIHVFEKIK
jgi:hypothetical protein